MTEAERQRVLAGGHLITDQQHLERYHCPACKTQHVVPNLHKERPR